LSPLRASLSVAVGLFVGTLPIYGFQLFVVLAVCIPLRLDSAVAYVAAHVSNPLTLPLLLLLEVEIGALVLTGGHAQIGSALDTSRLGEYAGQLLVGAPLLGLALGTVGATATWAITGRRGMRDPFRVATERTVRRYATASHNDRMYVRAKLEIDPLARALSELPEGLGRLTDAGCGLGQIGLCLLELRRTTHLVGFDPDPESIQIATRAGMDANFSVAAFESFSWPESDTVLFADSLHYASLEAQDAALHAAAKAIVPGGRVIIREVDARPGWRSRMTRLGEYVNAILRRRPSAHAYRTAEALTARLTALGLVPRRLPDPTESPFDNTVIIADKPRDTSSPHRPGST
jgi:uncharacterized protein (DUF2062 family)